METSPVAAPLWVARATKATSIGAIVIQLLEFFNQFSEEVEYVWKLRTRFITYLYFWCRYISLCAQIINFLVMEIIDKYPTPMLCMSSFVFKAITTQLTTSCLQAILMVRVHALYNCSRSTGFFLFAIYSIGTILEVAGTALTLVYLQSGIGENICVPAHCSLHTLLLFAAGCGLIQSVLLALTVSKIYLSRKAGWLRTPVITLMLRDGISVFVLLAVVISGMVGLEVARSLNNGVLVWNAAYSWYISLVSIAGCRMILGMRKLGATDPRNRQPEPDLTFTEFSTIIYSDDCQSTQE